MGWEERKEERRQLARGLFKHEIRLNDEKQGGDRDRVGENWKNKKSTGDIYVHRKCSTDAVEAEWRRDGG